jgi:hypothetical protein
VIRLWVVLLGLMLAAPARAGEPVRLALLVGANLGSGARRPLRYAESDASKLGEVLNELGGFHADNVHVLASPSLDQVMRTLEQLKAQVRRWHASQQRVVLLFFFSGHSDGEALELGADRWQYPVLLAQLKDLGADVRITIVDSCQSGALLARKGGTPGPTFDIRFSNDLDTTGEAVLTSSAADELALESRDIRASFFSHHLISGLRGAADTSGDGRVTLEEAYRHAFLNTLLATSGTLAGPQHPGYDFRMSGQGQLVLTDVSSRGATLTLPDGFDQILVADEDRRTLVVELTRRSANRIALPPGHYVLQGRRAGRAYQMKVRLGLAESRSISPQELASAGQSVAVAKGGLTIYTDSAPPPDVVLTAEAGTTSGVADALPFLGAVTLTVRSGGQRGFVGGVELATARATGFEATPRATGFRETHGKLVLGAFASRAAGRLSGEAGWRVVGGPIHQSLDRGGGYWSWCAGTGPWVGAAVALSEWLSLSITAGLDGLALRRDGGASLLLSPHASAGLRVGF